MRNITFVADAFAEFSDWATSDRKTFIRITRMLEETRRTPFEGIGKPEPLRGNLAGYWSRRISGEHRLVYSVSSEIIIVIACKFHY